MRSVGLLLSLHFFTLASLRRVLLLKHSFSLSQTVGKYLLSPDSELTPSGQYAASLSIRSGQGTGTHDRVFRFVPQFLSSQAAITYALEQGQRFVRLPGLPA